jgi:hypothetical protein
MDDTAPAAPEPARDAPDYEALVRAWFNDQIADSPVSRSVEAVNHLNLVAIPALIAALKKG